VFRRLVDACLVRRRWVIGITAAAFAGSIAAVRRGPEAVLPASDRPELMVDLWLPQAATFEASEREVQALEQRLKQDPDVVAVTSYVGTGSPRFYLPLDVQLPNTNFGQVMVMTQRRGARARAGAHPALFDSDFPNVRGRVSRLENGPPVGYPVKLRVSGPDGESSGDRRAGAALLRADAPCATSTPTWASACRPCAWSSTRTRRARSAVRRSRSPTPRRTRCRASASPSTARATS
jgi:multidrug efflux pump